jgi:hypothetical protein
VVVADQLELAECEQLGHHRPAAQPARVGQWRGALASMISVEVGISAAPKASTWED